MTPRTPAIGTRLAAILLLAYGAFPDSARAAHEPPVATAGVNAPAPLSEGALIHTSSTAAQPPLIAQRVGDAEAMQFPSPAQPGSPPRQPPGFALPPSPGLAAPQAPAGSPANGTAIQPGEDIRDIRGLKYVLPPWLVPALLAGTLLLAFLLYGLWRWYGRRRRPRILLPFELALQRLEDIRTLMQPAQAREFSIAVSDIVRSYLEQRFEVTAAHRTTEEFLHDLLQSANPSLARHRGLLANFLEQCDLAKFAGMSLTLQSMESLHHSARTFVLETAKPDPPQSAKPPAAPSPAPARTPFHTSPAQPRHAPSQPGAGQPAPSRAASKDGA